MQALFGRPIDLVVLPAVTNTCFLEAVERQLEVIGEALNRISTVEPETVQRITNYQRIIGFRNLLIHGHDAVDDAIVWDVIVGYLPLLQQETLGLLGSP